MKKIIILIVLTLLCGCTTKKQETKEQKEISYINSSGTNILTRINTPSRYTRKEVDKDSFAYYVRNYTLKEDGSPVLLYNGKKKNNQNAHIAVFKLPIENDDLQQCADSIMRMYGEYYYSRKEYNKISFKLGNNFKANFKTWSQGKGIKVNGNNISWVNSNNDASYKSFKKFIRIVFAYSGTLNLVDDSKDIKLKDINIGDVFIHGGSPGHVVMVVDVCTNSKGQKAFLLAQGYMPAQEFHIIKNPRHTDNPWYYQEEVEYPFKTSQYTFNEGSLKRLNINRGN